MPLYEYTCAKCENEFEQLVRSTRDKVKCPSCGSRKVEKKFSLFGMKSADSFTPSEGGGASCSSCSAGSCSGCSEAH